MKKKEHSRRKIRDEFTDLLVSRQRKYQLRQKKAGRCVKCGKPLCSAYYCLDHLIAAREKLRKKIGAVRRIRSLSYRLAESRANSKKRNAKTARQQR